MIDLELLNKLVLKTNKANPDRNSQELLQDVIKEYCKRKAPLNYEKKEAETFATEMIINLLQEY